MATEPYVATFEDRLNGGSYPALAVDYGLNRYPVSVYEGRLCCVTGQERVWGGKGRNYHDRYSVHFLDDGSVRSIPAGRFNNGAKAAPLPQPAEPQTITTLMENGATLTAPGSPELHRRIREVAAEQAALDAEPVPDDFDGLLHRGRRKEALAVERRQLRDLLQDPARSDA